MALAGTVPERRSALVRGAPVWDTATLLKPCPVANIALPAVSNAFSHGHIVHPASLAFNPASLTSFARVLRSFLRYLFPLTLCFVLIRCLSQEELMKQLKNATGRINPSTLNQPVNTHAAGTREFEGKYWQKDFAYLLREYKLYRPWSSHTFGTITRAELIRNLHSLEANAIHSLESNTPASPTAIGSNSELYVEPEIESVGPVLDDESQL